MPSSSDIIAIAAAVIAFCALFATIWQAQIARRHSRLSVRPHLHSSIQVTVQHTETQLVFAIKNIGLGPAIVKSTEVLLDGKVFNTQNPTKNPLHECLRTILGGKIEYFISTIDLPNSDEGLIVGEERLLLKLKFPECGPKLAQRQLNAGGSLAIVLRYESMYKELYSVHLGMAEPEAGEA